MILFMFVRTPRVLWKGISGSVEFTSTRKTPRNSRHDLVSPAMRCECAMEPIGMILCRGLISCCLGSACRANLSTNREDGIPSVPVRSGPRNSTTYADGLAPTGFQQQQPFGAGEARKCGRGCNPYREALT